ncbi:MAG: Ig-like domain-containing protein, partial [Marinoscillum sp.]
VNATVISVDTLDEDFVTFTWDVADLDDGLYEIRAISECSAGLAPGVSELVTGRIDRQAPEVVGTPSPVDAVLGLDDEISITFDEIVNCDAIISLGEPVSLESGSVNHINLTNTELGISLEKNVSCVDNRLVITPDIQNKFIEGQVLRVDILGIEDAYGNVQTDPISWEFNVSRNPLAWLGGDVQSVTYEGESPKFVRQVKNNGAFSVNVNLSGELDVQTLEETPLPDWLTASPRSFTLQPGATQDITFTVSDQLGGGQFIDMVTAATSFGAPELRFDVRVLCPEPNWSVNASDFEYSTTLTGQLDVRGTLSEDEYDMVAAYAGDELRGVGQVVYAPELAAIPGEHPYLVFLTIYSNSISAEQVDFQVWDASRCQLYGQVAETYEIGASSISIGSPTNPANITVTNNVVQHLNLKKGWNWVSFNLSGESAATNSVLSTLENS